MLASASQVPAPIESALRFYPRYASEVASKYDPEATGSNLEESKT